MYCYYVYIPGLTNAYAVFGHDDCFSYDVHYPGHDLNNCGAKTDTVRECYLLCQNTIGCVQFTWLGFSIKDREGQCCLKNTKQRITEPFPAAISGPKSCGKYFSYINML